MCVLFSVATSVAESIAERVLKILEKPFFLDGHEVYVSFSIGIAIAPEDGDSIQTLLKNADAAMYFFFCKGKNNYHFYNPALNDRSFFRLTLESDLRNALQNNQLYLFLTLYFLSIFGIVKNLKRNKLFHLNI